MSTGNKYAAAGESGVWAAGRAVISHYGCPAACLLLPGAGFYFEGSRYVLAVT